MRQAAMRIQKESKLVVAAGRTKKIKEKYVIYNLIPQFSLETEQSHVTTLLVLVTHI